MKYIIFVSKNTLKMKLGGRKTYFSDKNTYFLFGFVGHAKHYGRFDLSEGATIPSPILSLPLKRWCLFFPPLESGQLFDLFVTNRV